MCFMVKIFLMRCGDRDLQEPLCAVLPKKGERGIRLNGRHTSPRIVFICLQSFFGIGWRLFLWRCLKRTLMRRVWKMYTKLHLQRNKTACYLVKHLWKRQCFFIQHKNCRKRPTNKPLILFIYILYYTIRNKYQTIILAKCAEICIVYIDIRMKIYKKCRFTNKHKLYTI